MKVGAKTVHLGRLTRAAIFAFRDWIREQEGDPWEAVERVKEYLTPDQLLERVKAAEEITKDLQCFSLATATAQRWMHTEEGMARLLHGLMLAKDAKATIDQAFEVFVALGAEELAKKLSDAGGEVPGGNEPDPATAGSTGTS